MRLRSSNDRQSAHCAQPPARQYVPLTSCHISTELYQRDGRPMSGVSRDGRPAKPKFPLMCLQSQLSCKTLVLATSCLCGIRPYHIRHFAKLSDIPPLLQSVWTQKNRISSEETELFNQELLCSGGMNGINKHSQMFVPIWHSIHRYLLAGYICIRTAWFMNKETVRLCNPYDVTTGSHFSSIQHWVTD